MEKNSNNNNVIDGKIMTTCVTNFRPAWSIYILGEKSYPCDPLEKETKWTHPSTHKWVKIGNCNESDQ